MNRFSILALGVMMGVGTAFSGDAMAQTGRADDRARVDEVCVYKDINYFGAAQCYRAGDEINNLGAQNNSISSIRVYGRATVTVYEKTAFGGNSAAFSSDVPDLGKRIMQGNTGWSDRIASLRISGTTSPNDRTNSDRTTNDRRDNDRRDTDGFGRNQTQQPRDGICIYELPNYDGRSNCWNQGQNISDTSRVSNWNGQIASIRLFGNRTVAVLYQETGYRGESMTIDRNMPDLDAVFQRGRGRGNGNNNGNGRARGQGNGQNARNWDGQISSLKVQVQRQVR